MYIPSIHLRSTKIIIVIKQNNSIQRIPKDLKFANLEGTLSRSGVYNKVHGLLSVVLEVQEVRSELTAAVAVLVLGIAVRQKS